MRKALTLFLLILLFQSTFAVIAEDSIEIFAVTDNGKALSADLLVRIKSGSGMIWTSVEPLVGTSTQSTERLAVETARKYSEEVDNYDYFFEIKSDASLVEGPSAGAAMTLLVISMLQHNSVPDNVSLTGTITSGGGVGPVGGVFEKSKEAARIGIELFMIPPGESRQTVKIDNKVKSVNLVEYAEENWGLKVVEVNNIDEVLQYAFSDIEAIDVNTGQAAAIDFVPTQLELNESLLPMKSLTERYISEADDELRSAKTALSGTMLNEPALIDAMLSNLNQSEKMLEKSKILYEQNYLYSSANYAFLATTNSRFIRDIAENPSLLSSNSTAFDSKVADLERKINAFSFDLNRFVSVKYFEWHVASKERLLWAKLMVNKLKESNEITIVVGQNGIDWERVSEVRDYEHAVAWYEVSKDFFELTKDTRVGVLPDEEFNVTVDLHIVNTENGLRTLGEEEAENIQRRLDGAKLARDKGWMYAALFDSASSLALTNAAAFIKNRSLDELQAALNEKISELEQKIQESQQSFVWAQLYLDHSKFYRDSSLFYEEEGQTGLAVNNAKSGIELVFLAQGVFDASDASYAHFESLPSERFFSVSSGWQERLYVEDLLLVVLFSLGAGLGILLFALIVSGKRFHFLKPFSFEDRLDQILLEQRRQRKRFEKGYLTKQQFDALNEPIQRKINKLLAERRGLSANYVELDLNKCRVLAFERALRDLKMQLKKKQITSKDYALNASFYKKKINLLKHLIEEEEKGISLEKKKAEREFEEKPKRRPTRRRKKKK